MQFQITTTSLEVNVFYEYVTVRVHPGQMMTHGGSSDLCASVELYNITDGAKNKEHAAAIAKFVESKLSIPQNRYSVDVI